MLNLIEECRSLSFEKLSDSNKRMTSNTKSRRFIRHDKEFLKSFLSHVVSLKKLGFFVSDKSFHSKFLESCDKEDD